MVAWITTGPDGALWFTEQMSSKIGRITTSGSITSYPVPSAGSQPWGITTGPDGALWFTESNGGNIGRGQPRRVRSPRVSCSRHWAAGPGVSQPVRTAHCGLQIQATMRSGKPPSARWRRRPSAKAVLYQSAARFQIHPNWREWVSIYGTNPSCLDRDLEREISPTSLGGTSVTIDGTPAYLSFVSPTQINIQAPNDTNDAGFCRCGGERLAGGQTASTVTLTSSNSLPPSFYSTAPHVVAGDHFPRSNGSGAYGRWDL